jgi:hypothetical protein
LANAIEPRLTQHLPAIVPIEIARIFLRRTFWVATGPTYRTTLRTVIRNSYQGHYRRMVPKLLAALEFRSNNERHHPVMQALELVSDSRTPSPVEEALGESCW